eukprot:752657-Hanusia_phi.AAC.2
MADERVLVDPTESDRRKDGQHLTRSCIELTPKHKLQTQPGNLAAIELGGGVVTTEVRKTWLDHSVSKLLTQASLITVDEDVKCKQVRRWIVVEDET